MCDEIIKFKMMMTLGRSKMGVKEILMELCKGIYELALTDSGDDSELSLKMWDLKENIINMETEQ